ncbi:hypothetical protein JW988_09190 [Candidatus Bathyarchaeota archaeon]|nr:hypothetical protein [Candidatus Bathyarchaeota archaeon]
MSRFESLLNKIQSKFKDHCEFRSVCPYFDPDNYTCANNGGSHCGKYRRFKKEQAMNASAKPADTV